MITQEKVHELFEYVDGKLFNKTTRNHMCKEGNRAGCINKSYVRIIVDGVRYREHQLVFMMFHGYIPKEIDHIKDDLTEEGIKSNKIENLRSVDRSTNNQKANRKTKDATSKYKGVYYLKTHLDRKKRWVARFSKGSFKKLIYFNTELEAAKAYDQLAKEHYGEHAFLNFNN